MNELSLDAKMIAATNMAVAEAIWQTYYLQRGGTPTQPPEKRVLNDIKQAVKRLEEIAQQLAEDAGAEPQTKVGAGF